MWDMFDWALIRRWVRVSIKEEVRIREVKIIIISKEITVENKALKVTKTIGGGVEKEGLIREEEVEVIIFEKSRDKILQTI